MAKISSSPLRAENAIESASFAIVLNEPLNSEFDAIKQACLDLKDDLPGDEAIAPPFGLFQQAAGGTPLNLPFSFPPIGLSRFSTNRDGSREWQLDVNGNLIVASCFNYTNHAEVWAKMRKLITTVISSTSQDFNIVEIGYQVVDKFLYPANSDLSEYDIFEVFSETSPFLTSQASKSGYLWHVHQGWFDTEPTTSIRLLNQLNLASNEVISPEPQLVTIIDHRVSLRPDPNELTLKPLINGSEQNQLDHFFESLRSCNRKTIENLLNSDKLNSVGIMSNK